MLKIPDLACDTSLQGVGALIRQSRQQSRLSQMDLALDVGISPRHLSFVETGRSKPGAEVLLAIAQRLGIPLRTRNLWLLAAGYAPRFSEQTLSSQRMAQVRSALIKLLTAHNPYPGVVLDRHWNVVLFNQSAQTLLNLLPDFLRTENPNMFRASLHPQGFSSITRNFGQWGSYLIAVLEKQLAETRDAQLIALAKEVLSYPNVQELLAKANPQSIASSAILVPCELEIQGTVLSFFTTVSTFGTPRDITLDELCIELFYPADELTEKRLNTFTATSATPSTTC